MVEKTIKQLKGLTGIEFVYESKTDYYLGSFNYWVIRLEIINNMYYFKAKHPQLTLNSWGNELSAAWEIMGTKLDMFSEGAIKPFSKLFSD
ncbi:hypothetical protein N9137_02195 [Pseudomonadales bacterium]|nr:hypothetical protein [Pseudomonadales bacterium]